MLEAADGFSDCAQCFDSARVFARAVGHDSPENSGKNRPRHMIPKVTSLSRSGFLRTPARVASLRAQIRLGFAEPRRHRNLLLWLPAMRPSIEVRTCGTALGETSESSPVELPKRNGGFGW